MEVRHTNPCATSCTVRTAEETVMRSVVVVLVGTLSGSPVAGAQQDRNGADGCR